MSASVVTKSDLLHLYRRLLRGCQTYPSKNREKILQSVREDFRENMALDPNCELNVGCIKTLHLELLFEDHPTHQRPIMLKFFKQLKRLSNKSMLHTKDSASFTNSTIEAHLVFPSAWNRIPSPNPTTMLTRGRKQWTKFWNKMNRKNNLNIERRNLAIAFLLPSVPITPYTAKI